MQWVVNTTPKQLYHLERGLTDQVSIVQEAGWVPGPVWTAAGKLAQPRFDPQTFQPVSESLYWLRYTGRSYIYIYIYRFKGDTALCWAEILKLIVNTLARFIQKRTGKQFLTFVVEQQKSSLLWPSLRFHFIHNTYYKTYIHTYMHTHTHTNTHIQTHTNTKTHT